jgi:hypothetical protein
LCNGRSVTLSWCQRVDNWPNLCWC